MLSPIYQHPADGDPFAPGNYPDHMADAVARSDVELGPMLGSDQLKAAGAGELEYSSGTERLCVERCRRPGRARRGRTPPLPEPSVRSAVGVKGGAAGERSERTLDAHEHLTTLGATRQRHFTGSCQLWTRSTSATSAATARYPAV